MKSNKDFQVGEEVFDITAPETRAIVTRYTKDDLYVLFSDGSCGKEEKRLFKRTGRRFDLQTILKELG